LSAGEDASAEDASPKKKKHKRKQGGKSAKSVALVNEETEKGQTTDMNYCSATWLR
jgi:hypothetical protein